jgi:hypothetical protein
MTRDDIIRLAREAGFFTEAGHCVTVTLEMAERFAALVAKAERDRICEMLRERHKQEDRHNYYGFIANMIEEQK